MSEPVTTPTQESAGAQSLLTRTRARIGLEATRKVYGLLAGRAKSRFKGNGEDFDDMAFYHPGDDVSSIDWKATARTGEPLIRRYNEDRNRSVMLVVDIGHNMATRAPDGTSKQDAAMTVAGLIAYLCQQHGDILGLVAGDARRRRYLPARNSTGHLEMLLRHILVDIDISAPEPNLGLTLERAYRVIQRRSILVIITDEARPEPETENILRRLRARHELMVVRVADSDPLATEHLNQVVADIDAWRSVPQFVREKKDVQEQVARVKEDRRKAVDAMLDRQHIPHILIKSADTAVDDVIQMLKRRAHVAH